MEEVFCGGELISKSFNGLSKKTEGKIKSWGLEGFRLEDATTI